METEISSVRYNPLMDRSEMRVEIDHGGEPTPSKEDVKDRIAAEEDIDSDEIEVVTVKSAFGRQESAAELKIFESLDPEEYDIEEPVSGEEEQEDKKQESSSIDYDEIVSGTISEAKDELKAMEDPDYEAALEAEKDNKNRKTLVQWLESRKE